MRPSGESAGDVAESAKLVSCVYSRRAGSAGCRNRDTNSAPAAARTTTSAATAASQRRPRLERGIVASAGAASALCRADAAEIDDHVAHRLEAVCGILLERLLDNHAQRKRHVLRQRLRGAVDNRVQDVEIGRSGKRSLSGQRFVQHDAERENIASGVERLSEACSGDMYATVPTMIPARVRVSVTVGVASSDVAPS